MSRLVLPKDVEDSTNCPNCGAPEKDRQKYEGFGGCSQIVCKCGYVVEQTTPKWVTQ